MDDWATSSPWAETTNDDDDFDDFQTSSSSAAPISNGDKGPTTSTGAPIASEGGVTNGFKVTKEPFANGWGFGDHDVSHDTDVPVPEGWKSVDAHVAESADDKIAIPSDESKLKPGKSDWEYRNEWAKTEESLAPSDTSNVWNKSDDPEPEPEPEPTPNAETKERETLEEKPSPPIPDEIEIVTKPTPPIAVAPKIKELKADEPKQEAELAPALLKEEQPPADLEPEKLNVKTIEKEPSRSTTPVSMGGDDFGDFEDEDDSIVVEVEPTPPPSRPASQIFDKRNINLDNFAIGNLTVLDSLYKTKPVQLPSSPESSDIISTTSQRKTWYRLIRKESARNSIQGEDVLRVRWTGSETQKKVHDVVKRWISEDRISGRTTLGRNASGMFDWNSTSPRSSSTMSPPNSSFPPPKPNFEPAKRLSMGLTSPTSPRSPRFGWGSAQSPRNASFGRASGENPSNSKTPAQVSNLASPQSLSSPNSISAFPQFPRQPPTPSRHMASSSVDLPRPKPTPSTARPTSMFVGPGSKNLFGELSLAATKSPPLTASSSKTHSVKSSMDLSIFDKQPSQAPESQADTSFDDDFGDFEGPGFGAPPPQPAPQTIPNPSTYNKPIATPSIQQNITPFTVPTTTNQSLIGGISSLPSVAKPQEPPSLRSSLDILAKAPQISQSIPSNLGEASVNGRPTPTLVQPSSDPWGSFDIFDGPKPAQPVSRQPPQSPAAVPPSRPSIQTSSHRRNGSATAFQQTRTPALPILSPPRLSQPNRTVSESAVIDDDFDDWGEMITTPSTEQKMDWPPSQTPKLSVSSEPPVRRRSFTLDMFGSPDENITSANPMDLLPTPKPASTKRVPSPISIKNSNLMPTIPATPSPGAASLFSSGVLVPNSATPTASNHSSSALGSPDSMKQSSPTPRNASFVSLNSLGSLSAKIEEPVVSNKRFSTPILPTQQLQLAQSLSKPTASSQTNISSPLAAEWNDLDFGSFEDATPQVEMKAATPAKGLGHRSTVSVGNIAAPQPSAARSKHVSKGSVTMSPIVGRKDEDAAFNEIIELLPDLGYMLR
ncbi:hypothetical protein ABW20_dc0101212 [Dactylellina cionopaga]|nr:hypothetical protein ABW20_dc0101212 [Dactylellina cionopaga]